MSHIYQPLMIRTMLLRGGRATTREIAAAFLAADESQLDYYGNIVQRMPGQVLRRRKVVEREGSGFILTQDYRPTTAEETGEAVKLCDDAIATYTAKRGAAIWQHRMVGLGQVPGRLRYDTLKRAGFHCELCGISADERALDVDHILPRKHGGTDDPENLQALCWLCNANKGAGDATDFGAIRESYAHREPECPFCDLTQQDIVESNGLAFAIRDRFPVTLGHTLIIPRRHVADWFDLTRGESAAVERLLRSQRETLQRADSQVAGFNVGINCGAASGQTVFHSHVHLIPRRPSDVPNPRGGVRHVIAGKGDYGSLQ